MSRFLYWTIVVGAAPTAFRAASREELLPTLRQLQRKHPEASLKWFARGRFWASPEEAAGAMRARRRPVERRVPLGTGPSRRRGPPAPRRRG